MVFNSKETFFLDLGSEGAQPAKVAIKEEVAIQEEAAIDGAAAKAAAPSPAPSASPAGSSSSSQTTAEAIAAELRASQEALPPPSNITFAPDCLNPANAVPTRRRKAGANLNGFRDMGKGLFKP
ncbi:hypothetical protein [Cyanobium sp. WAJ14-Wanaka]|uniref:hypothetical protein n=1 Tax=Cyanobium sp. WAJ14-Wanaka TaxID=2823725 RepID=UPI0020CF647F|nr:hypothetical protein [Cyanobium sp. WAJ14-Wanaka]MCP9774384.1 hypothetical protein [Cyanobium sp. WAJ14-Wanaka]